MSAHMNASISYIDNAIGDWVHVDRTGNTSWEPCLEPIEYGKCEPIKSEPFHIKTYPQQFTVSTTEENKNIPEGVEMKNLYDVYLIYGENRKDPFIKRSDGIIASDEEDAKIKSGLMKEVQEDWDADYLTFIVNRIGEVKVKEKPKEVKQV